MADYSTLPAGLGESWDWQGRGACRTRPTDTFFHPDFERGESRTQRESAAKAVCEWCPVLTQCRTYALTTREPYGTWGGLTATERRTLLRGHRAPRTAEPGDPAPAPSATHGPAHTPPATR